ncbi:polysaccharide pyruvyl transferase family protein [Rhodopila sp.]|uniref:polysaccharide pyruvyl transferase family protein n=1 Tax=Rhodopila sp. TaxID=2480087 RepID=UPI002C533FE7|nr:polysaccharide pyruvyl transferase family protein [Rhodopila sp.]HVZ10031.1 polysaccharide pyruvyl transferase family protein [Rhodopila sp.]
MTAPAPILVTGMFDMDNFGDLLFPLLASRRLALAGLEAVAVAPSNSRPGFADAMEPRAAADMLTGACPAAGILIGGGYMIHTSPLSFLDRYRGAEAASWGGPGLWIGATLAAALHDVPIAWNAPGVPHPFSARQRPVVHAALRAASHVAVRDHASRRLLGASDVPVSVVPDPVADLPLLWPRRMLTDVFHGLLRRKRMAGDTRLLAIHVRNRSIAGESPARIAAALETFAAERGLVPMLLAVGESHDDPAVARLLAGSFTAPHLLLDDPMELREVAAALAHSALYVGASLHGYMVAAAYGVPGILVGRPAYHKFAGFLDHIGRPQDLAPDWWKALTAAATRRNGTGFPASVAVALDRHWHAVIAAFRAPAQRRAERAAFMRDLLRAGVLRDGPGWAMQPVVSRLGASSPGVSSPGVSSPGVSRHAALDGLPRDQGGQLDGRTPAV